MKKETKSIFIWGGVFAVLLFGLFVWFMFSDLGSAKQIPTSEAKIILHPESTWVPVLGSVKIKATVEPKELAQDSLLRFLWSCEKGNIVGSGAEVSWTAPWKPAVGDIKVSAYREGNKQQKLATASIQIRAVDMVPKVKEDQVALDLDANKKKTGLGYEIKSVTFDKKEICDTDEVRMKIEAVDPLGKSEWLMPVVKFPNTETISGFDLIGRVSMFASEKYEYKDKSPIEIKLYDMRVPGEPVATTTVDFPILECDEETNQTKLFVRCTVKSASGWDMLCEARHRDQFDDWYEDNVVRYEWWLEDYDLPNFPEVTNIPRWEYPVPDDWVSDKVMHTWIVHAKAYLKNGKTLEGRGMAIITDRMFVNQAQVNELVLLTANGVNWVEGDQIFAPISIRNNFPEDIQIESIEWIKGTCPKKHPKEWMKIIKESGKIPEEDLTESKKINAGTIDPYSLIGTEVLEGGSGWIDFIWKAKFEEGICINTANLKGYGVESGLPVFARFFIPIDMKLKWMLNSPSPRMQRDADRILSRERNRRSYFVDDRAIEQLIKEGKMRPSEEYVKEWNEWKKENPDISL
jgi:hypothetical protein